MGIYCCKKQNINKVSSVRIDSLVNNINNDKKKEEENENEKIKNKSSKILMNYSPLQTIGNVMTKTNTYEKQESYTLNKIKSDIKKQLFKDSQLNKTYSIENHEANINYFYDKNNKLKITLIKDLDYINNKKHELFINKSSSQKLRGKKAFEELPYKGKEKYNSSSPKKNAKLIKLGLFDSDDEILSSTKSKPINKTNLLGNDINTEKLQISYTSSNKDIHKIKKEKKKIKDLSNDFTENQKDFLIKILTENELINSEMYDDTINKILDSISYKKIKKNVIIFTQDNNNDDYYYIIEKGKLEYSFDDELYELYEGNGIGTKALLKYTKINCYIKTLRRSYLFVLPLEQYRKIADDFENSKIEKIIQCFKDNFFFSNLDNETQNSIAQISKILHCDKRSVIIEEKKTIQSLYLIIEGKIICSYNNMIIKNLEQGEIFGENNLFHHIESLYSYINENQTILIQIKYKKLLSILSEERLNNIVIHILEKSIKECKHLQKYISKDNLSKIFPCFSLKYYKNSIIIPQDTKKIIIPISGTVFKGKKTQNIMNLISTNNYKKLKNGEIYMGAITLEKELESCIMGDECIILETLWDNLLPQLSSLKFPELKITIYDLIKILNQDSLFNFLPIFKIFQLANTMKIKYYNPGQIILKNGPISDYYYYIQEGKIEILIENNHLKKLTKNQFFGDIISQKGSYSRKANFISLTKVICLIIEKETYEKILEEDELFQSIKKMLFLKDLTISLDSLFFVRDIGSGSYGKVYLVCDDKKYYAMKIAEKKFLNENKLITKFFINEKIITSSLNFPFIVHLINTYKTREYLFFLMEFVDGISLRKKIKMKNHELNNIEEIQFYGAILFSVLNYLQKKKILHRDFKPDNIMIDTNGYLKVIDFGVAYKLENKDYTNTIIGTCHYMSPEVIEGKNYSFNCDYWSIGIILYEIFYGKLPFGFNVNDRNKIYKEILENKIYFPDSKFESFNNLISNLLVKNPKNRITSFKGIISHKFFKNYNFDAVMKLMIKPKFIPKETVEKINKDNLNISFLRIMKNNTELSSNDMISDLNINQIDEFLLSF